MSEKKLSKNIKTPFALMLRNILDDLLKNLM